MKSPRLLVSLSPCLALCVAVQAPAAELAAFMPAETILYLESSGSAAVGEARASTALGKLLAEPEMHRFGSELRKAFAALKQLAAEEDEEALPAINAVLPLLEVMLKRRVALDVIGIEMTPKGPGASAVLAIEVGDQAESFMKHFEMLLKMLPLPAAPQPETVGGHAVQRLELGPIPPLRYGVIDGVFLLTLGEDMLKAVLAVKSGSAPNLSKNEAFSAALRRLESRSESTAFTLHIDPVRLQAQGRALFTAMSGAADFPPPVPILLEELGVSSVKSFTYTAQFKNGACQHAALLATQGPAKGLLKLLDGKPLADEDFHAVARDAAFAQVGNCDLKEIYDETLRIIGRVGGEPLEAVNEALATFEAKTQMKLREDVIAHFDDGWAFFDAPSNGGLWIAGLTLVVETKDAKTFMEMLDRWVALIQRVAGEKNLTPRTGEFGGHAVRYAVITAAPVPVSPAWGAHGNRVVMAMFPQIVQQTLERMAAPDAKERCILANPDFSRGRKLLPDTCSSVTYVDTLQGVSDLYTFALPAATAGATYATSQGVPLDPAAFPTRQTVVRHLFGDVGGVSRCEDGILFKSHGPLPMSIPATFSGQQSVATTALIVSILLPSLSRARELSKRTVSQANLRGIGLTCQMYAREHDGKFPPNLKVLVELGDLTPKILISPRDPSPDDCSYVYIPGQTTLSDARNVLAYEPDFEAEVQMTEEDLSRLKALGYINTSGASEGALGQTGEGGNILFVDGHVEWVKPPRFYEVIAETRGRLGKRADDPK